MLHMSSQGCFGHKRKTGCAMPAHNGAHTGGWAWWAWIGTAAALCSAHGAYNYIKCSSTQGFTYTACLSPLSSIACCRRRPRPHICSFRGPPAPPPAPQPHTCRRRRQSHSRPAAPAAPPAAPPHLPGRMGKAADGRRSSSDSLAAPDAACLRRSMHWSGKAVMAHCRSLAGPLCTYVGQRDLLPGRNVTQRQDHRCGMGGEAARGDQ